MFTVNVVESRRKLELLQPLCVFRTKLNIRTGDGGSNSVTGDGMVQVDSVL